jgi:hypothetical protein
VAGKAMIGYDGPHHGWQYATHCSSGQHPLPQQPKAANKAIKEMGLGLNLAHTLSAYDAIDILATDNLSNNVTCTNMAQVRGQLGLWFLVGSHVVERGLSWYFVVLL